MSRNQNSHFALNPTANIKRSRFDISHTVKTTFSAGKLVPFECKEILPGDTFEVDTSILARMQTLIVPLMDDLYLDTYYFFVPNRLLWDHWQQFMGENDTPWFDTPAYSVPTISIDVAAGADPDSNTKAVKKGTVADYLGLPLPNPGTYSVEHIEKVSHLPFRAYCRIWNEWFRSENFQNLTAFNTTDTSVTMNNTSSAFYGGELLPVNRYRDYFSTCLPEPQRGPEVVLSVGDFAPVFAGGAGYDTDGYDSALEFAKKFNPNATAPYSMQWFRTDGNHVNSDTWHDVMLHGGTIGNDGQIIESSMNLASGTAPTNRKTVAPANLLADISAVSGISINELRMAFATQRFYEASARSGSRYIEILDSMFGVTSPDSRLQRSEYLGGNRVHVNINMAVQQSETDTTPLASLGAYSLTTDNQSSFTHSFVEHGYIIGVMCVRYDHSYSQGIEKHWLRKDKFDYYWPMFSNIGEQPVLNKQIYVDGTSYDDEVFGYNEAWAEYRYANNIVTGEFRPTYDQTLDYWHLGDNYSSRPFLGDEWIVEDGAVVDRAIAVSERLADQFMVDMYINCIATRPMPLYSIPGLTTL